MLCVVFLEADHSCTTVSDIGAVPFGLKSLPPYAFGLFEVRLVLIILIVLASTQCLSLMFRFLANNACLGRVFWCENSKFGGAYAPCLFARFCDSGAARFRMCVSGLDMFRLHRMWNNFNSRLDEKQKSGGSVSLSIPSYRNICIPALALWRSEISDYVSDLNPAVRMLLSFV